MTKNTKEISISDVPNFAIVKGRILGIDPNIQFVKAGLDKELDTFTLRLQSTIPRHTDLDLPENLLRDLGGKNYEHRDTQLEDLIRIAIDRLK
jgi:hypothetical protein